MPNWLVSSHTSGKCIHRSCWMTFAYPPVYCRWAAADIAHALYRMNYLTFLCLSPLATQNAIPRINTIRPIRIHLFVLFLGNHHAHHSTFCSSPFVTKIFDAICALREWTHIPIDAHQTEKSHSYWNCAFCVRMYVLAIWKVIRCDVNKSDRKSPISLMTVFKFSSRMLTHVCVSQRAWAGDFRCWVTGQSTRNGRHCRNQVGKKRK